ncbi:MAG: dockerin type I repeat-containing protein, partial [Ruminococcus sp.]|nr:dockerin type I repeat-containing protein [Ruminococcus sp.]
TYKSTLPDECGFELSDYTFDSDDEYWRNGMSWWENGVRLQANKSYFFTAGREYDVCIAVNPTWEPQFKYADTSDMTVTVNGNPATIERATSCYLISYTFTIPAETTGYILGDVDGDGKVSVVDATIIQRHVAQLSVIDEESFMSADVDKDGKISVMDATIVQRFVAQIIPSL